MLLTSYGEDTIITRYSSKTYPYTILNYVDTMGCMSCRLQLQRWKSLISELQEDYPDRVNCLMVFYSNQRKRFVKFLQNNDFESFVFMDDQDTLNKLNHFLQEEDFRTFLLDKSNKVVAVGNPILNPNIRSLYLSIISGGKVSVNRKKPLTKVNFSMDKVDLGTFSYTEKQVAKIAVTNVGANLLFIDDVVSSCGCVMVNLEKKVVRVGETIIMKINYKGDAPELINEQLSIFCNVPKAPLNIRVVGNAQE